MNLSWILSDSFGSWFCHNKKIISRNELWKTYRGGVYYRGAWPAERVVVGKITGNNKNRFCQFHKMIRPMV